MSPNKELDKQVANRYLYTLAKEYRKTAGARAGKAEIVVVGGASVMFNYDFRNATGDIDALILSNSTMKDAINKISDEYGLDAKWINSDFTKTESYSHKLRQCAKFYRTFAHAIDVYTINAEYLIAMKLVSGRDYKKDLSDIVGILSDQIQMGRPVSMEQINEAVVELYGKGKKLNEGAVRVLREAFKSTDIEELYNEISFQEAKKEAALSAPATEVPRRKSR
jgi:hypothetical protein